MRIPLRLFITLLSIGVCLEIFADSRLHTGSFIENKGQIVDQNRLVNSEVLYLYSSASLNIQLRKSGYSYEFLNFSGLPQFQPGKKHIHPSQLNNVLIQTSRIDIDFAGMNQNASVQAQEMNETVLNDVRGGKEIYGIRTFRKITYNNVYDHTDIEFLISTDQANPLKYNIILHPGADPSKIKFSIKGTGSVSIKNGSLVLKSPLGQITEKIPFSYYLSNPRQNQTVSFSLQNNVLGFNCDYKNSETLVIDPSSNLMWSSYYGGSGIEYGAAVATETGGNVYYTGHTVSSNNIATAGVYQNTIGGDFDIFLAKFSSNGQLLWGTYFGGSVYETAFGICLDASGNIYVSGDSGSSTNVASLGAHQTVYGGGIDDAVLIKFDATGQRIWSTYYGGNLHDIAFCVTVDNAGNVVIAGHTESVNGTGAIATLGAYQTSYTLGYDVFIAKFNPAGVRQWGTYYGDSGFEEAWAIATDATNNVIITGFSSSISGISSNGSHQQFNGGSNDGFIAKFDPMGTTLIWGTYYGGSGDDAGAAIKIDSQGKIFVGGNAGSTGAIATPGAYQMVPGSAEDGFLACFTAAGIRMWGTYFGGNGTDYVSGMALDANQNIIFCGETLSTNSISTAGAFQPSIGLANTYDMYFARFKNTGGIMLATYYGSSGNDNARAVAIDNFGKMYICGETTSTTGIATASVYMSNPGGGGDGVLARFCLSPYPSITPATTHTMCLNDSYTMTASAGYSSYLWSNGFLGNPLVLSGGLVPGNFYYYVNVTDADGCTAASDSVQVIVNNCLTGMNESPVSDAVTVFPIPAHDHLFVKWPAGQTCREIEIYSVDGKMLLRNTISDRADISVLPAGFYFLRTKNENNSFSQKFIKY